MATFNSILTALGRGDRATGVRLAAIAAFTAAPLWLGLAVFLAVGPGR